MLPPRTPPTTSEITHELQKKAPALEPSASVSVSLLLVKNVDTDKIPAPAGALESLDEMQIKVAPQRALLKALACFQLIQL